MASTDVLHDERYLLAAMNTRDPRQHAYYSQALQNLRDQQAMEERQREFAMRMGEASRTHSEATADRELKNKQLGEYRAARLSAADESRRQADMQHLGMILAPGSGFSDAEQKQARAQVMQHFGIQPSLSPEVQRENAARAAVGAPPVQAPAVSGGGAPAVSGGGAPAGGGGEPTYPAGSYPTPSGIPHIGGSPAIPSNQMIQHGTIVGGPPGYDLNINTGRFIPSGAEGVINGRPAGEVNAELAIRHGRTPESPSGQRAMAGVLARPPAPGGEPGQPTLSVNQRGFPVGAGFEHPAPVTAPGAGAPAQTTAATAGGGAGAPVSTPGSQAPAAPGLQPFGQPTQFHTEHITNALSNLFTPGSFGVPSLRTSGEQPPLFAPSSTATPAPQAQMNPAAPTSGEQRPPPAAGQGQPNAPIRPVAVIPPQPMIPPPRPVFF